MQKQLSTGIVVVVIVVIVLVVAAIYWFGLRGGKDTTAADENFKPPKMDQMPKGTEGEGTFQPGMPGPR